MALSADHLSVIAQWAYETWCISEVWLFGSRARGNSRPDSDIDLAVALESADPGKTAAGNWERFGNEWQRDLRVRTGRYVSLELYESVPDLTKPRAS